MREPEATQGLALQVAVVGSGPSGCYVTQFLTKADPRIHVTVLDRLPVPFGLVRYGVAADHQGTKAVTRQFERVFDSPRVRFAGNVALGRDVTLDDLEASFDAVVLATGLHEDRPLELPGAGLPGVVGAGTVTRFLNGHPDEDGEGLALGRDVVVVGAGNVAVDVVRLIAKAPEHYEGSDMDDDAHRQLASQVSSITLIARSSAADAKFDRAMIRELGDIDGAEIDVHGLTPDAVDPKSETVRALVADASPGRVRITLRFQTTPVEIVGEERVEGLRVRAASGESLIPADTIVTAVGFTGESAGPPIDRVHSVGWARRGPVGTIPDNRADAKQVAADVLATLDVVAAGATPRPGFDGLPKPARDRAVGIEQWRQIDAYELASADPRRVRRKIRTWAGLLGQRRDHEPAMAASRPDDNEGTDS